MASASGCPRRPVAACCALGASRAGHACRRDPRHPSTPDLCCSAVARGAGSSAGARRCVRTDRLRCDRSGLCHLEARRNGRRPQSLPTPPSRRLRRSRSTRRTATGCLPGIGRRRGGRGTAGGTGRTLGRGCRPLGGSRLMSHASGTIAARALAGPVRVYQRVTANRPTPCRYLPTCSNYALDALEQHGACRGTFLSIRRICRCHPWGGSGMDPVPQRKAT